MSRIGKAPITLPKGVKAVVSGNLVKIEGPKGKLERACRPEIKAEIKEEEGAQVLTFERNSDSKDARAFHGMERALASNMVQGCHEGFEKILDVNGVGYKAEMKGKDLNLGLGYSHDIKFKVPDGVTASVLKEGRDVAVKLESCDKQLLGQVAAQIRSLRPPEPYKGKGVKYRDEVIRRKAGKAGK